MIHKGRPAKGRRGSHSKMDISGQRGGRSSEDGHFWTEGREGSDAPGRPEAFFECFAYFTFFLKFLKKKILQTGRPRGRGGVQKLEIYLDVLYG